ncbi:Serine/threonine-protein phosphatase 7 long form-like protein [Hordeum vulgare]|nr:Serine/threonine-protein phosphatase 7 long form-like protein [Hordeum vulgare]
MEKYTRAYLWYLLTEVVFPDYSGNNVLWMYLDFLKDWDEGYNWGSAGLAYPYHSSHAASSSRVVGEDEEEYEEEDDEEEGEDEEDGEERAEEGHVEE